MADEAPIAWVTGASGFIGRHVAHQFAAKGWRVGTIDRLPPPDALYRHMTAEINPCALAAAVKEFGVPDALFHGAGNGSVGRSIDDPAMCRRDTLESTVHVLDFLRKHAPACRLVFPSSAAVYGVSSAAVIAEDCPPNPVSPYGEHKLAAERACLAAADAGQPVAILRMFSVYGPGLRKQLPWDLGRRLLAGENPVELFGSGAEIRDFLAVADAARFIVALATTPYASPLIVNGGTGRPTTVAAFAQALRDALELPSGLTFNGRRRQGDPPVYCADITRLTQLGLHSTITLTQGLAAYARWLQLEHAALAPL